MPKMGKYTVDQMSRPARGARIEIGEQVLRRDPQQRRAPQGARGLKSGGSGEGGVDGGRAPQGARGLKSNCRQKTNLTLSRAPQGARGLKSPEDAVFVRALDVAPRKGRED